jgi:hypothetical protein
MQFAAALNFGAEVQVIHNLRDSSRCKPRDGYCNLSVHYHMLLQVRVVGVVRQGKGNERVGWVLWGRGLGWRQDRCGQGEGRAKDVHYHMLLQVHWEQRVCAVGLVGAVGSVVGWC